MYDQPPAPCQPRALVGVAPCAHSLTSLTICEGAARGSPCTTSRPPRAAPSPRWCCPLCTQSYIPNYLYISHTQGTNRGPYPGVTGPSRPTYWSHTQGTDPSGLEKLLLNLTLSFKRAICHSSDKRIPRFDTSIIRR
ncbi:hypothetical protein ACJJTC_015040 [Scirpophaga incertulas]